MSTRPYLKALVVDVIFEKLAVANWSRVTGLHGISAVKTFHQEGDLHGLVKVELEGEPSKFYEVTVKEKR